MKSALNQLLQHSKGELVGAVSLLVVIAGGAPMPLTELPSETLPGSSTPHQAASIIPVSTRYMQVTSKLGKAVAEMRSRKVLPLANTGM